jgi:poly(hydroxyalkanoate) depolymerase family esterase
MWRRHRAPALAPLTVWTALAALALAAGALLGPVQPASAAGAAVSGTTLERTTPDGRAYSLFVPVGHRSSAPRPLVVMLHGCTQDRHDFAAGTAMNEVAQANDVLVAYPEQTRLGHPNKCWRWFDAAHQTRGSGEPASLAGVVADVADEHAVNPREVYVAGLSAGGAMSVVLGATYPDVFAAVGVGSGLEYKAGENELEGLAALPLGGPDPDRAGRLAYQAMGEHARSVPVMVFHGTADPTVNPVNGEQVIAQWAQTDDLASDGRDDDNIDATPERVTRGQVPGGHAFTHSVYLNARGDQKPVLEYYSVDGMRHAWSGGSSAGSYTDPKGPDASALMWEFFDRH